MLLYHCPECGHWADIQMAEDLTNILNLAAAQLGEPAPVRMPIIYPCPYAHGPMAQVLPTDRIFVRQMVVESGPCTALVSRSLVQH